MATLAEHLKELAVEDGLGSILLDLAKVEISIYDSIRMRDMVKRGDTNATGDTQSALDVVSEELIAKTLDANEHVCSHLSEECVELKTCSATGTYFVSYDPYDGGSVGDADITVGSIFGIWSEPPVLGTAAGKTIICGAYTLWGPNLAFAIATREHGVFWYEYDGSEYQLIGPLNFDKEGLHKGIFCPGDSPAMLTSPAYEGLLKYAMEQKFRLRYTGCCMTDTHHVLHKKGMFWYPPGKKGGLRLMYEAVPLGFMIIVAGGTAIDHTGAHLLEVPVNEWHQRSSLMFVSPGYEKEATERFLEVGKGN